jgi:hypothetical protein
VNDFQQVFSMKSRHDGTAVDVLPPNKQGGGTPFDDLGLAVSSREPLSHHTWLGIGGEVEIPATQINDGFFSFDLDFGSVYADGKRWLEVVVDGTTLSPRQAIMPTPVALYALSGNAGPQGDKGDTGEAGPKGDKGDAGAAGADGAAGAKGDKGDTGATGAAGAAGAPGLKGDKGDAGEAGPKGDKGDAGTNGVDGAPGLKGDKGDVGEAGPKGDKGDAGTNGVDGAPGLNGANGVDGQAGPKGDKGDAGTNGVDGAPGLKGDTGATGAAGAQGIPGLKGDKGDTGAAGAQGIPGLKGDTGATGATGAKGDTGAQGIQGVKGDTGATGAAGTSGAIGAKGAVISTSVSTTSTSYTDLSNSSGPFVSVTVPASGTVLVTVTGGIQSNYNGEMGYMGFAISGASTASASDARSLRWTGRNETETFQASATFYVTGLTAGTTNFTAKYRTESGGTHNSTFSNRNIIVIPVP